ncbi:hypothetical protein Cch01nite_08810 [Cellulomonas chitinilytica]|uniref:TFIIS-type domain-containing protein n=1 Tax=Cellulomonas chitinilytica TaxID=398759 RepID=A0A919NZ11_9CELL|nr:hypothetical protein [Cellulomonas chitinilytica]GIG20157.1 hypothetical protein Cch01nite_08810 [Cellulomonas chitinilytica]
MARRRGDAARARAAQNAEPLGSLSQASGPVIPGTEACQRCGERDLTRIRMTLVGGRLAVFVSCPSCEQTNWFAVDGDGSPLGRGDIGGDTGG